ncbi:scavenger receptor cysteine-rich type 1 protein M130-like isoform X2 [Leucoraja erinacea]|uniref:scavenger receptor cysteine-rich type 1 protein M130-like isoform X2 n=1 Tax=Leucoraja erinaceus TaxID=7782 RepID=UPI002456A389|nr:scavenger receptor cysteine-rich type 1 protein M130-like isoform X2 [Leucoraja erinacea]
MAVYINCTGPRSLRLSGGTDKCAGTVDVHVNGRWGSLCDAPWDLNLADSVCQFLGCGNVSSLLPGQEGRAEFQADDCSGNGSSIPDCIQHLNDRQCPKLAGVLCTESLPSKDDPTNVTSVPLTTVAKREDRKHRGSNRELNLLLIIGGLAFLLVLESVLFLVFCLRTKRRRESTGEHFGNVGMTGISQDMDIVRPLGVKVRGAIKRRERMEQDLSSSDEEIQVTRKQSSKRTRRNFGSQIAEDSSSTSSCEWYENVKGHTVEGVTKAGDKDTHHLDIPAVNSLQNSNTTLSLVEYENYYDRCMDLTQKDDLAAVTVIQPVAATDHSSGSDYDDIGSYEMS